MRILALEVKAFGCEPTETRHLIGRLSEIYCARHVGGKLARRVNQAGFDAIGADGRRISVKTTAQKRGFVSFNERTARLAEAIKRSRVSDSWRELNAKHYQLTPMIQNHLTDQLQSRSSIPASSNAAANSRMEPKRAFGSAWSAR